MINNLVIKVEGELNPKHNDILIYNSTKEVWEVQSKIVFLNEINHKIKVLEENFNKKLQESDNKITKNQENIGKIANLMKKGIK